MKIGIIGAGHIGHTAARLLINAGHEVTLSNSRGPQSLQAVVAELGPNAHAATVDQAAHFGEVVFLAVPWATPEALPHPDMVANKIVIDAMNPYSADYKLIDLGEQTSSEETANRLPDARLVKAFNTIRAQHLADQADSTKPEAQRRAIFMASNDARAKAVVADLIRDMGFAPVDTGSLRDGGRRQGPIGVFYDKAMTGEEAQRALADA